MTTLEKAINKIEKTIPNNTGEWKEYKGYLVHSLGAGVIKKKTGRINKIDILYKKNGNNTVRVFIKAQNMQLSRALWEAFNGEIPKGKIVDFIDGNRLNVRLDNLRLTTRSELSKRTIKETMKNPNWRISKSSKPVRCIETGKVYKSITEASKAMGVSSKNHHLNAHLNGWIRSGYIVKSFKGYTWEFVEDKNE